MNGTKCNVENMTAFVAALRSGEFKQGIGSLRQATESGEFRYCCLGVATELALRAGVTVELGNPYCTHDDACSVWAHHGFLADEVAGWLGINSDNPTLPGDDDEEGHPASVWNDSMGATFDDIAGKFEARYLKATVAA